MLNFYLHNRTVATDVSITHPASKYPFFCKAGAKALGAAAGREKVKKRQYSDLARTEHLDFMPFCPRGIRRIWKGSEAHFDGGGLAEWSGKSRWDGGADVLYSGAIGLLAERQCSGNADRCTLTRKAASRASRDL